MSSSTSSSPPSPSFSSPSPSPEPQISPANLTNKSKVQGKKKKSTLPEHGRDEGFWVYDPPQDAILLDRVADVGEFDWDTVNGSDDLELWLIRVPDAVKPKYLEGTNIQLPSSSKSARVGTLNRKHATYDIWSVGHDDDQPVGGEEIKSLTCLLPKKNKKGKLFQAPKAISRHLVISAQPVTPTSGTASNLPQTYKNPPRQSYPKELLKHKFMPYGSETPPVAEDVTMDSSNELEISPRKEKMSVLETSSPAVENKKPKGRKRKGDLEDTPTTLKKTKKVKTTS